MPGRTPPRQLVALGCALALTAPSIASAQAQPKPGYAPGPRATYAPPPPMVDRSTPLKVTGLVMAGVGLLGTLVGGGALLITAASEPCAPQDDCDPDTLLHVGLGAGIPGLVLLAAGLPMAVVGSEQVPARRAEVDLTPRVTVGPTRAQLTWTF